MVRNEKIDKIAMFGKRNFRSLDLDNYDLFPSTSEGISGALSRAVFSIW